MKINNVFVSSRAINLVRKLSKKGMFRADAFVKVDQEFKYPAKTMATCFGRLESSISKRKQSLHTKFGGKSTKIPKPKYKDRWPKWKSAIKHLHV